MTTISAPISLGSFSTRIAAFVATFVSATAPVDAMLYKSTAPLHSRANYGLGRQVRATEAVRTQTLCEIVTELKENGMPVSAIAEIGNVERKTVYSWLKDEATPRQQHVERMTAIFSLLKEATGGQYRPIFRVFNSKGSDGRPLREVLSAPDIDLGAVRRTLSELEQPIKRYVGMEAVLTPAHKMRPGSPFLDEWREAGIR